MKMKFISKSVQNDCNKKKEEINHRKLLEAGKQRNFSVLTVSSPLLTKRHTV